MTITQQLGSLQVNTSQSQGDRTREQTDTRVTLLSKEINAEVATLK